MSLFRQLLIANSRKKKRPYYCGVEYLESTGTQWIDTLWSPTSNDLRVKFKVKSMGSPHKTAICGAEKIGITPRWVFILYGQNTDTTKIFPLTGDWNNTTQGFTFTSGSVLEIDWTANSTSTTITDKVSNTTYTRAMGSTINYPNNDVTLKLFQNIDSQKSSIQMHYYQIYQDGKLVRDFIPVLDWDMKPCMYDKVSGELFRNKGTGEFLYGRQIHPVEYLESTGTQYINTGINGDNLITSDALVMKLTSSQNECVIGCWNDPPTRCWLAYFFGNNFYAGHGVVAASMETVSLNEWHTIKTEISGNRYNYIIDGTKYKFGNNTFNSNQNIYMFAMNDKGNANYYSKVRVSYAKIYDGDTLLRDYIPMVDELGVGAMFDRVSHTIYDNAGQGAFSYPPVELEYLESTGTQYIDTGYVTNSNNPQIKTKLQIKSYIKSYQGLFANYVSESVKSTRISFVTERNLYSWYLNSGSAGNYRVIPAQFNTDWEIDLNEDALIINGVSMPKASSTQSGSANTATMKIFAKTADAIYASPLKMYYFKMYDNSSLVRDYIPVYYNGSAGMWDKVNEVFYPNNGTGSFITGRVKESEYE